MPMRQWQRECAEIVARFLVLALHRRAGKTELALKKLCNAAVKNRQDLPLYFYVSPYLKQSKAIAWARLKQMVAPLLPWGSVEINESELYIRFLHNNAMVRIYGADNPDAMRGVRLDGVVVDEVAQVKPDVWDDILQPALADRQGWAWFIGTPSGINLFSQLFYLAANEPGWANARYTVYDTDALNPTEVERLRRVMNEMSFAREFLCDFTAAADNQLLSMTDIETSANRKYRPEEMSYAPKILGVDPARFGNDRSVSMRRQGMSAYPPKVYRGLDNMELAARIAMEIDEWQPDAVFIDSGAGSGVIDRLRQLDYDVIEVNFGSRATQAKYVNKRTEMWYEMADWVRNGGALPNDNNLKLELATPTYKFDAANRIVLESKDEIRKRMPDAGSPDIADALGLTFAFPVQKKNDIGIMIKNQRQQREYDPLDLMAHMR